MEFKIQYDDEGNYRLIVDGKKGQWSAYNKVAIFGTYVAFSEYWNRPATNRVFSIVDDKSGTIVENVKGVKPK